LSIVPSPVAALRGAGEPPDDIFELRIAKVVEEIDKTSFGLKKRIAPFLKRLVAKYSLLTIGETLSLPLKIGNLLAGLN
jgi:hypothetical protein